MIALALCMLRCRFTTTPGVRFRVRANSKSEVARLPPSGRSYILVVVLGSRVGSGTPASLNAQWGARSHVLVGVYTRGRVADNSQTGEEVFIRVSPHESSCLRWLSSSLPMILAVIVVETVGFSCRNIVSRLLYRAKPVHPVPPISSVSEAPPYYLAGVPLVL